MYEEDEAVFETSLARVAKEVSSVKGFDESQRALDWFFGSDDPKNARRLRRVWLSPEDFG